MLVVVDPTEDGRYTLEVLDGRTGMPVADRLVEARTPFVCPEGWDTEDLFVVFRQADGTLVAVRARFDAVTGELLFETDLSGVFAVVSFPYAGELFSDAFYAALETLDAIRDLPVRR